MCADIAARQALGVAKYGVTVQDNPLFLQQWLQHAYEECLDQAVYLRRAMQSLAEQPAQGCDHCNHSLYAGTKCKNCGRVTEQAAIKRDLTPEQPAQQEPVAWKHDCAALLTNDVELWIDQCPHCGKPRTSPQPARQEPTVENNSQNWRGMDGTTAYWLIQRHADGWPDVEKMMTEWLEANRPQAREPLTDEEIIKCWGQVSGTRYGYVAFARAIEAAHGIGEKK